MKAVSREQPRFDVVILVIVLAPVGGAVQPIAAATLRIDHSGEFVFFEIIRLMEGVRWAAKKAAA